MDCFPSDKDFKVNTKYDCMILYQYHYFGSLSNKYFHVYTIRDPLAAL